MRMRVAVIGGVLVAALLAWACMPLNDGLYDFLINYDPQGDAQQREMSEHRAIFRYTSGILCGHLLAIVLGGLLGRAYPQRRAIGFAALAGVALAVATAAVALPVAARFPGADTLEPAVVTRVVLVTLTAFPLYAVTGAALGRLLRGHGFLLLGLAAGWVVAILAGLFVDGEPGFPGVLRWLVPPLAAASTIAEAGTAVDVDTGAVVGDRGLMAGVALLTGLSAYAVATQLAARRRNR